MMNTPLSSSGKLVRYLVAGPLVLAVALGAAGARAQGAGPVVPAAALKDTRPEPVTHYIDGKLSTLEEVLKLGVDNVASADALEGEDARKLSGNPQDEYVMAITTKQNQHRADVVAFNARVARADTKRKAETNVLAPVALSARTASSAGTHLNEQLSNKTAGSKRDPKPQPLKPGMASPALAAKAPFTVRLDGKPSGLAPVYYVDGKVASDAIHSINPADIASINVFKGEQARRLAGDVEAGGIVVITTKQNLERPDVRAFNEKMGILSAAPAPAAPTASVPYLAAPALAYITRNYPDARLLGVTEVRPAVGGATQYKAELAVGRRPVTLLFDERGGFVSEVPYSR